jgi:hypothetical protein
LTRGRTRRTALVIGAEDEFLLGLLDGGDGEEEDASPAAGDAFNDGVLAALLHMPRHQPVRALGQSITHGALHPADWRSIVDHLFCEGVSVAACSVQSVDVPAPASCHQKVSHGEQREALGRTMPTMGRFQSLSSRTRLMEVMLGRSS